MANFAELTARLNLDIHDFASKMKEASVTVQAFAKNIQGKINDSVTKPAKKSYNVFTDIKQIVQGILISQAFYQSLRVIKEANSAVWEFARGLEYAEISYSNLFGNKELAQEFINVLKDFAAVTPFSFADAEKSAKRLLAYGVEYKNIMFIMRGVMAASAMTGDPQTLETVARAIGQISTKGRLYNEEMRALAKAGIPVFDILQDKLGLTDEQLRRLSKNAIPASVAINALIDGITERFGNVADVVNLTMKGLISNLKDNLMMIGAEAIQPLYDKIRSILAPLVDFVGNLRDIVETSGIGGLFEKLVPPEMQSSIRQFIANLQLLWRTIKDNLINVFKMLRVILLAVIQLFNAIGPIIMAVINVISRITGAILSNEKAVRFLASALAAAAAMWVIFKLKAVASAVVAAIVTGISKAIAGLSVVMTWIVAHPFWTLLIGLVGLVVALSGGFGKLGQSINNFFKQITSFGGVDPDKVLLPSQKERAADLDKFNERLSDTSKQMDKLSDSTGKATKAAKGLLAFDEVFKLKQPDEGAGAGGIQDFGDWDFEGIGGLGDILIPEVPDFSSYATDFVDNLLSALGGKKQALSLGIGALIGASIGGLVGGIPGALIGAAIGSFAGWFWPKIADKIGLSDVGLISLPVSVGIGAAIGAITGGPMGAAIGSAIGALVGWIIDKISTGISTGDWSGLGIAVGAGVGGALGFVVGGPAGAVIGVAAGGLVGHVVDLLVEGFTTGTWHVDKLANSLGPLVGAGIGAVVGGPAGAAIGAAVGGLIGWLVNLIVENWPAIKAWFEKAWEDVKGWVTTAWSNIKDWAAGVWESVSSWFSTAWANISEWFSNAWSSISSWFSDLGSKIGTFFSDIWSKLTTWVSNIAAKIGGFFSNIWSSVTTWFSKIFQKIATFFTDAINSVSTSVSSIASSISNFFSNIWTTIKDGVSNIYTTFKNWVTDLWNNVFGKFFGWIGDGIDKLKEFFGLKSKTDNIDYSFVDRPQPITRTGHSLGGIFRREHVARFAEGNKAEAAIPLENGEAMRPFVNAISNGVMQGLLPTFTAIMDNRQGYSSTDQEALRPLYVGTLIADERSLKELQRKMNVIQLQEGSRRG